MSMLGELAALDRLPDVGLPPVGDGGQFSAGLPAVNRAADIGSQLPGHMLGSILSLPQRAIENSQYALESGNYDASVPVEAALMTMGTGAVAGVPVRGRDVALGAGPVRKTFTDDGLPIAGGGYTKRAREVLDEIAAGQKGAGPMDMSMSAMTPDVPQVAMDRLVPPRGVSPRLQDALQNQDMIKGVRESIERGVGLGADKWYHNEPVRQAFLKELGKEEGAKAYTQFMDHVAATSPRSDVPTNIRNASFQYQHARKGQDLPDKLPYPYGHVAQNLHRQNFEMLTAPQPGNLSSASTPHDFGRWDIYQNPKPASFSQNLQGNLEPGTMDTHAFRNIGMRTGDPRFMETSVSAKYKSGSDPGKDTIVAKYGEWTKPDTVAFRPQRLHKEGRLSLEEAQKIPYFWAAKPNPNEYGAAEQLYKRLGQERGLPTADAQAAAWAGGGDVTGLGTSAVHTFPEMMNERILFTAKMRGEDPTKTLSDFIRGNRPLLSIGGATAIGGLAAQDQYQP